MKQIVALYENPYQEKIEAHVTEDLNTLHNEHGNIVAKEVGVVAEIIELPIEVISDTNEGSQESSNEVQINNIQVMVETQTYIDGHSTWCLIRTFISLIFLFIILFVYVVGKSSNQ